jgi:hypothetical protein
MTKMKRPHLNPAPLPNPFPAPGELYITVSPDQWDALLQDAYERGWTLIEIEEIDGKEQAVRAFKRSQKPKEPTQHAAPQRKFGPFGLTKANRMVQAIGNRTCDWRSQPVQNACF